jgi:hypothetical protein
MSRAPVQRLLGRLWSSHYLGEAFAILDGARDPRIAELIRRSGHDSLCLFSGSLAPQLAQVAPWIVHLRRDSAFTHFLLSEALGQSWGIFLLSDASLIDNHRHFRTILRVQDHLGTKMLFRYYDPRVLRAYLPTCLPGELATVFGPVIRFFCESEDGHRLESFSWVKNSLVHDRGLERTVSSALAGNGDGPQR